MPNPERANAHVHTVYCPEHKGFWTGLFMQPVPEQAVCKDCIKKLEMPTKGHRDIIINPTGE